MDEGDKLLLIQRRLMVGLLSILFAFAIYQISVFFADMLRIFGISILLSYLFINVVDWLTKRLNNRAVAIFIVYALVLAISVLLLLIVVPSLVFQVNQLFESTFRRLPQLIETFIIALKPVDERLAAAKIHFRALDMLSSIAGNLPRPDTSLILGRVSEVAMSTMTWLFYGLSILVLSFYFLLDGHRMLAGVIGLFPRHYRPRLSSVASEIDLSLQSFFRGQIVMALLFALFMMAVYFVMGVQFALVLGVILAVWEIVPVIGPPIGFAPAVLVVLLNGMDNISVDRFGQIIILLVVINIAQWLKDNLVAPRYIGNRVGLHPVVIFLAIMLGARLDGILGIIFAIPFACALNAVFHNLTSAEPELHDEQVMG